VYEKISSQEGKQFQLDDYLRCQSGKQVLLSLVLFLRSRTNCLYSNNHFDQAMKLFLLSLLLIGANTLFSQIVDPPIQELNPYTRVDEQPQFPGGEAAMQAFLDEHTLDQHLYGRISLKLIVTRTGTLEELEVILNSEDCAACATEAIHIAQLMPRWTPGKIAGKAVDTYIYLPINFKNPNAKLPEPPIAQLPPPVPALPDNTIYNTVDETAQFPGGMEAMKAYLKKHIELPQHCVQEKLSGKCYLRFTVTKTGEIQNVTVAKPMPGCPEFGKAAVEAVKTMPAWIPAKSKGKAVHAYYTLPVQFNPE
jgi:TonB family protein